LPNGKCSPILLPAVATSDTRERYMKFRLVNELNGKSVQTKKHVFETNF